MKRSVHSIIEQGKRLRLCVFRSSVGVRTGMSIYKYLHEVCPVDLQIMEYFSKMYVFIANTTIANDMHANKLRSQPNDWPTIKCHDCCINYELMNLSFEKDRQHNLNK